MKSPAKFARKEIRMLKPCVHGGEVMELTEGQGKKRGEIIDFSSNVNPLGPPSKVLAAIKVNLWRIPFYPDSTSRALRVAIARHVSVSADNIIVGNGSTELIWLFAGAFIKKGDEALMSAPTFGEYEIAVRGCGGRPKFVRLNQNDFCTRAEHFLKRMNARTKVVFLCNPNNPTGQIIPKEDLLSIVEEAKRREILVFIDEDFIGFVDRNKRFTLAESVSTDRNVFVLRSFTKIFALAGIRIGYGVGCGEIIELLHRSKPPWNVNCLAQVAAMAALEDNEYIDETQRLIAEERARMLESLAKIDGVGVFPTDANFFLINIRNMGLTAAQLKEKLLEHGVMIRNCSSFVGLDEYFVRISIRTRKENAKLLEAMRSVIGDRTR